MNCGGANAVKFIGAVKLPKTLGDGANMNNHQEIDYSKYFVAFLDILGFRNLVFSNNQEKLNTYFSLIDEITNDLQQIQLKKDIGSITISDSVILSIPMARNGSERSLDNLRQLFIAIQKIQFQLALKDIWLRGAVSFGDAYFNEKSNQVVGKAYIHAYELEQKIAIYPRVVIDSRLIKEFDFKSSSELINSVNNHDSCSSEYEPTERNILFWWNYHHGQRRSRLPNDIPLFIDYLVYAFESEENLSTIVRNIEANIYSDNNVYYKFRWVADYLIQLCEFYSDHGSNIDKDVIRDELHKLKQL